MSDRWGDEEPEAFSLATPSSPRKMRTLSATSEASSAAVAGVLPESICPVCFNLGNEIWDENYCKRHGIEGFLWGNGPRPQPIKSVAMRAQEGCPGCEIIAWVLDPYTKRLQDEGREVKVTLIDSLYLYGPRLLYFSSKSRGLQSRIALVIRSVPFEFSEGALPRSNSRCHFEPVSEPILQPC
jgi:hypothetical protein